MDRGARLTEGSLVVALALCAACGRTTLSSSAGPTPGDSAPTSVPPPLVVGYDAFRHWDRLPYVRLGVRTYMRSTYDHAGGNEAADASHYLREVAPGDDVALDIEGTGTLEFFRANRWHGSPWHFVVDGTDDVVSETATATPDSPPATSTFLPSVAFPSPLAETYATTQGGDVSWAIAGFTRSLSIAHGRSRYGTGYYVYSLFDPDAIAGAPITAWSESDVPPADVVDLMTSAGTVAAPTEGATEFEGAVDLAADGAVTLVDLQGPATLRVLRFTAPMSAQAGLESARLRITWDGRASPSVDAPVPLFFGTGTLYNRSGAAYLVRSLPAVVRSGASSIELSMAFPMPFLRSARVELVGGGEGATAIGWQVRTVPYLDAPNAVGYFHATYVDHGAPTPGLDLTLLDTTKTEDAAQWCGSLVGTSVIFSDQANLTTLEGDPRFFFDDSQTPQAQGTGTEEWGAGGDYWNGGQITTGPLAGHPVGAPGTSASLGPADSIESMYRFLIADAFPFGRNAQVRLEHGGLDDSTEHYRTVTYWYGTPSACLVPTDSLHVSDPADESAHDYVSPQASTVDTLTSRYEWGVDHVGSQEVFPALTDTGRHTTGTSEMTFAIRADNDGVLLRRRLDYAFVDQRAAVFVADASEATGAVDATGAAPMVPFAAAGIWYLAGSNTCAFVDAPTETGTATPAIETSNRQWRDDEFLIPRSLTEGRDRIRVRIVYEPRSPALPVAPGAGLGPQAWSEYRYTVYSYVMPLAP